MGPLVPLYLGYGRQGLSVVAGAVFAFNPPIVMHWVGFIAMCDHRMSRGAITVLRCTGFTLCIFLGHGEGAG